MRIRIHYEINGFEDSYILEGDTIESIREINASEMKRRKLDMNKNNCWSEEV